MDQSILWHSYYIDTQLMLQWRHPLWAFLLTGSHVSQLWLDDSDGRRSRCSTHCSKREGPSPGRCGCKASTLSLPQQGTLPLSWGSDSWVSSLQLMVEPWCSRHTGCPGESYHSLGRLYCCMCCPPLTGGETWADTLPPGYPHTWLVCQFGAFPLPSACLLYYLVSPPSSIITIMFGNIVMS